jgi:Domain of unknown function (DUF4166)
MSLPLYRRVLGARFEQMPARVRELHDIQGISVWAGMASVERGQSLACRLAALVSGLPPEGRDQPLRVTFAPVGARENWSRQFGSAPFRSVQYEQSGLLCERVGPTTFVFAALASAEGLVLRLEGFRLLGVPLPRLLHPSVRTFEGERDGRYQFEVEARLPLFGLLVRYGGWLMPQR